MRIIVLGNSNKMFLTMGHPYEAQHKPFAHFSNINLPTGKGSIHNKISSHYLSIKPESNGMRVRDWLKTKSFQFQYEYGIKTLKENGWY